MSIKLADLPETNTVNPFTDFTVILQDGKVKKSRTVLISSASVVNVNSASYSAHSAYSVSSGHAITSDNSFTSSYISDTADISVRSLKSSNILINGSSAVTSIDLELELMKSNFQYVSWAQFSIYDSFDNSSRRLVGDTGTAVVSLGTVIHGDELPNTSHIFNSKIYQNITTLFYGTGSGGYNYLTDITQNWFINECKNLTLVDSAFNTWNVSANTSSSLFITDNVSLPSGIYYLHTNNPTACLAFFTYTDSTSGGGYGYTKLEFSVDGGNTYVTILDTLYGINKLGATINFMTEGVITGHTYCARITIKNDALGRGSVVHNFLIGTDPSPWRW